MNRQKKRQPTSLSRQAGSKQKLVSDTVNIHQQSSKMEPARDSQNTVNNVLAPTSQKSTSAHQEEEIVKATILLFEHIEEQVGRADIKAQLTLAADALISADGILSRWGIDRPPRRL